MDCFGSSTRKVTLSKSNPYPLCPNPFSRPVTNFSRARRRGGLHNRSMRTLLSVGILAAAVAATPATIAAQDKAPAAQDKAAAAGSSIAGGWTRNADLSDLPSERGQGDDSGQGRGNG